MRIALHPRVASTATAACIAGIALAQLRLGEGSTPVPLRELAAWLFGHDAATASRIIVGAEFALAAAIAVTGARVLTVAGAGVVAFVSLACLSAALRQGGVLIPALSLAGSTALAFLAWHASPRAADASSRRGLSPAWTALLAIATATAAGHFASSAAFATPRASSDAEAKARSMSIDLDLKPYIGTPLSESPIATYMPSMVARIGMETAFIVFYNPACDACHTLFSGNFAEPRMELVFAVEIPLAEGAVSAAHGEHEPIECAQCSLETLPPGPLWLIAPPMTVKVERGVITCVADRFGGDCLNPQ